MSTQPPSPPPDNGRQRAIDIMLQSEDSATRAQGRLFITSFDDTIQAWVQREAGRGTSAKDTVAALCTAFGQILGSMVTQVVLPAKHTEAANNWTGMVREAMLRNIAMATKPPTPAN
jgi:hypothetical protein